MSEMNDRVITGFRPTGELTVGTYLGAIKPSVELQADPEKDLYVFVADIHGLTDTDPHDIAPFRLSIVRDLIALGIDPQASTIYMQSDIESPTVQIANRVAPYIGVRELSRTPTLKEKMQAAVAKGDIEDDEAMRANYALLGYPVLMAADIYAQQAGTVAVGEDQSSHIELARAIARKFNNAFGEEILVEPQTLALKSLRILSLDGRGKMSSSNPNQAVLFSDDPEQARLKIRKAATAGEGEWNEVIESHFTVAELTATTEEQKADIEELKRQHASGKPVMRDFKKLWGQITEDLLANFQSARVSISEADVKSALRYNADKAERNANGTFRAIKEAMGF